MSIRRRLALAIRLRQVLARRRDALLPAPRWRHADGVAIAARDAIALPAMHSETARRLAPHLDAHGDAHGDAHRDATSHTRSRAHDHANAAALGLHAADRIVAEAEAALAGRLHLLGADLAVPTEPDGWRTHPLTG